MLDTIQILTKNWSRPFILKGYANVSYFRDICTCIRNSTILEGVNIPYIPGGSTVYKMYHGSFPEHLTDGNEYWYNHVCKREETYTSWDTDVTAGRWKEYEQSMTKWFRKVEGKMRLLRWIQDSLFRENSGEWLNQLFIGNAVNRFPSPYKSGASAHRDDHLNYYVQVCGSKRWFVGDRTLQFNDHRDNTSAGQVLQGEDYHVFMRKTRLYLGLLNPGDLLILPPWLWHFVQTDAGANLAITWKMSGKTVRLILKNEYGVILPDPISQTDRTGDRVFPLANASLLVGCTSILLLSCRSRRRQANNYD